MIKRSFLLSSCVCLFSALVLFSCKERGEDVIEREKVAEEKVVDKNEVAQPHIELLVDKRELRANGREVLTLQVKSSDKAAEQSAHIYYTSSASDEPIRLEGREFSTRQAGKYSFYARLGENLKSEPVEVVFVESVLTLKVEQAVIRANGRERVVFTLWQDGLELTSDYEILVASEREGVYKSLKDGLFTTTSAGEFFFIARYDGFQTAPVSVIAQSVELVLSVDKPSLIANGLSRATFSLSEDGQQVEDYTLYHRAPKQTDFVALLTRDYVFEQEGIHTFRAVRNSNTSNEVVVLAEPSILTLQVSKQTITADDTDVVELSVYQDGAKRTDGYQIKVKEPASSAFVPYDKASFKTGRAGQYVFVAELGRWRSAEVEVVAVAKPEPPAPKPEPQPEPVQDAMLKASKTSIIADGVDQVTFSVLSGSRDVTSDYDIYELRPPLDSEYKLSGATFVTKRKGTYTFVAIHRISQERTRRISINAEASTTDPANRTVFVRGVTQQSGWYDVNKFFGSRDAQGRGGDGVLCWAASASNAIEWWLKDYESKGYTIPAGTPHGRGRVYELAIFEEFMKHWHNYQATAMVGIQFFFVEPDKTDQTTKQYLKNQNFVGFFKNSPQWSSVQSFFSTYRTANSYVQSYGSYSNWHQKKGIESFTELILRLLDEGAVVLSVGGHEVSVWGIDLKDGRADYIYITNSDDRQVRLHKIKLQVEGNYVLLAELIDGAAPNPFNVKRQRIDDLMGLKAYPAKK